MRRIAGRVGERVGVQRAEDLDVGHHLRRHVEPGIGEPGQVLLPRPRHTLMSSSASTAPAATRVSSATDASDVVSVLRASSARSLANAPAAKVAGGRAPVPSRTSRPAVDEPVRERCDRPPRGPRRAGGRAPRRARARGAATTSESPSTPLATSLRAAASAGPSRTTGLAEGLQDSLRRQPSACRRPGSSAGRRRRRASSP